MTKKFDKPTDNESCFEKENGKDINIALRSEANDILGEDLKEDNATVISNPTTISDDYVLGKNVISDEQWLREYITKSLATNSPIIFEYHKSEIENVNSIIRTTLSFIKWFSSVSIALVVVFVLLEKDTGAIISLITCGIVDAILGILTQMFNSTLKSKKSYFDAESDSAKFNKMLLLIQAISNQNDKDSIITDILRKYFDIKDDKK